MAAMRHVGYAVFVRDTLLGHYLRKSNALRRCEAERSEGVDAKVYETWTTFGVSERRDGES